MRRAELEGPVVSDQAHLPKTCRRVSSHWASVSGKVVDDGAAVRFRWGSDGAWTEVVPMEHIEMNPELRQPRVRWK